MLSNKAIKIFVEPDEEIVFIVEKIMAAASGRIILIVPNTAALISSAVSLKVLARQILKTDKLIVLVSDTELAKSLGQKANIMVCAKVSEVSTEAWQSAKVLKEKLADEVDRVKDELLKARREPPGDPLRVEDLIKKVLPKKSDTKDKAVGMAEQLPKVKAVIMDEPEKEEPKLVIKPRLKERVVDINGFKLVAGGDVLNNKELLGMERDRHNEVLEIDLDSEDNQDANLEQQEDKDNMNRGSGLVGMDMTRQLGDSVHAHRRNVATSAKKPGVASGIGNFFQGILSYISVWKLLLGFFLAFAVFFAVAYFFYTSATVQIEQTDNTVTLKKTVTAKVDDKNAYNVAALTIPAHTITKDNTISSSAQASGTGTTGEFANGSLLIYNPGAADVKLKAGQFFDYNYNSQTLKYKALADITIPAASPKTATVNVKAENFGEQYNVTDTLKSFTVEGNAGLTAQNITAITGGTTTTATVVSQSDIDDLKASMNDQLKTSLLQTLQSTLSADDFLIEGSQTYNVNTFTSSVPALTAIANFSADLKMTISAVVISRTDVKNLMTEVGKTENGFSNVTVKDPVIENVKFDNKVATFDVRINAVGSNQLDVAAIKTEIKGMGVEDAKNLIKGKVGVTNVIVIFNPPFIPVAIQKIPKDEAKYTVTITTKTN